jgi:hypothetical protein
MTDEDRRKHLEMIQGVVARLAGNSFSINEHPAIAIAGRWKNESGIVPYSALPAHSHHGVRGRADCLCSV